MQRSEHPSGLFAGLAESDPPFLWAGDTVGIALTVVAASRSPVRRAWLDAPSDLPRVACAWQAHDRAAKGASPLSPGFAGCAGPGQLFRQNPIPIDHLDDYQRLASCTYEQLARRPGRWSLINSDEQHTVIIAHAKGTQAQWELSCVNEEGAGRRGWKVRHSTDPSRATTNLH